MKLISKVKAPVRALAKRIPALRKILRKIMYYYRRIGYMLRGIGISTNEKLIVLESFSGKSYSDTPKAVYEYMLREEKYNEYRFVWIFKEPEKYEELLKNNRTKLVKYRSAACERALAEAKYWIFNYRALDHWITRKDQVYVQCWHGTPLKRLGYDIANSDNAMNSTDEIRDKYYRDAKRFKYLLSPCAFATKVFKTAWNLKALGKEDAILEVGYPRNDFLVNYTEKDVQEIKWRLGLGNSEKKIILYAPTWRDNQHIASKGYTYKTELDFEKLKKELGEEYVILFRAHYLVANSFDFERYDGFVRDVSEVDDINELYLISDMLITDYSSVFFDYAILERPIIFYMYDLNEYRDKVRGFYLTLNELPGKIVTTEKEIIETLKDYDVVKNIEILREFNNKYNILNDGMAIERFVKEIFIVKKPVILMRPIFIKTKIVREELVSKILCLFKFKYDINGLEVCINNKKYPINFFMKKGIKCIKGYRFNLCKFKITLNDIENFDIQNKVNLVYGNLKGSILYNLFDFEKGKCNNRKIHLIGETAIYFRQSVKNRLYLTVRKKNKYDYLNGQIKIFIAYMLSKFLFFRNIILLFEKGCSQYEESASVLYEKLIDEGYKNCYYILDKNSKILEKIPDKYLRNIVFKDSYRHLIYFFKCKKFIGTETMGHAIQLRIANKHAVRKLQNNEICYIFLQHGVMYMISLDSDMREGFRNKDYKFYRVVVSSDLEAKHFIESGGFKKDQLYITGLAKFDRCYKYDDADKILIMFTWRRWEANSARANFKNTDYYRILKRVIKGIPEKYRDKIVVLPHPLIRQAMIDSNCEISQFVRKYISYDEALRDCDTLITDYSSIAYDAFYRGSNVIFYWEEKKECIKNYGVKARLMIDEKNTFGPVCWNQTDLFKSVNRTYKQKQDYEYIKKFTQIVRFHDGKNTERIFEKLKEDNYI